MKLRILIAAIFFSLSIFQVATKTCQTAEQHYSTDAEDSSGNQPGRTKTNTAVGGFHRYNSIKNNIFLNQPPHWRAKDGWLH
jgi:hypothetical protein